ncbi:hypothetical protein ACFO9Q_01055 [Paenibacillus sp. GCM10023252]|uniref:hypothetical protein n=1 Tax=Paenibacillus sp. GCM10023252 TaxID=3252649 RepID=UPI0036224E82
MIGTWRWNAGLGLLGTLLTALFSLGKNPLAVTSIRCMYAFAAFFLLAYALRAALAFILRPPVLQESLGEEMDGRGSHLDYHTPDEGEDLHQLLKSNLGTGNKQGDSVTDKEQLDAEGIPFRPLNPPQLVSTQNKQPEELARAVRHLTGG